MLATALLTLLLILAAVLLPQLPDQLRDEPAAAARWFLTTAASYGAAGPLMRSAGLFDVLHSLLFRLVLAALTLILAAHLADQLGNALSLWRIKRALCSLPEAGVGPATLSVSRAIHQRRYAADIDPVATQDQTREFLVGRFDAADSCRHAGTGETTPREPSASQLTAPAPEFRNLAVRNALSYWLRPLLPLALLAALTVVWVFLFLGWELNAPALAPGDTFRAPAHDVVIAYDLPAAAGNGVASAGEGASEEVEAGESAPNVTVQVAGHEITQSAAANFRARLGSNSISGRSGQPALLVRVADGSAMLAETGQSELVSSAGVVLPSPGSEESILIPGLSWGLRIVRRTDDPSAFFVELYEGAELRPQQRIDVEAPTVTTATSGEQSLELELVPLPGMEVAIRHMPARWLLWVALALAAAGFIGILLPPSVLLAQIAPWPIDRTVVTLYASESEDMEAVAAHLQPEGPFPAQQESDLRQAGNQDIDAGTG